MKPGVANTARFRPATPDRRTAVSARVRKLFFVVGALCVGVTGCGRPSSNLVARFTEGTSQKLPGYITSVHLEAQFDGPPTAIIEVMPQADPGINVEYLGYTTCVRGCPGAVPLGADADTMVSQGRDGMTPIPAQLLANDKVALMFRLTPSGSTPTLMQGCAGLRVVRLRYDHGKVAQAKTPGVFIAALRFGSASSVSIGGERKPRGTPG